MEDHEGDFEKLISAGTDETLEGIYYQTIAGAQRLCIELSPVVNGSAYSQRLLEVSLIL